ncbi:hypothetical protein ACFWPV_25515 [Streptomyces uncialis]|uniref:hypothetical protein n=1 Tax=Streptomyces uncialis TaxID=1048205 RepID=UPI00366296A3
MILTRPRAGVIDDVEREDDGSGPDGNGYETEEFHRLVQRLIWEGDEPCGLCGCWICRCDQEAEGARTSSGPESELACTACGGNGGRVEDTSSGGVRRQTWISCGSCSGSGRR